MIITDLEKILKDLLPHSQIAQFSRDWILNSPRATEDSVRAVYQVLSNYGLSDDKIASQAHLLGRDPETIERNYQSHVGLLRQNYEDRASGRELLTTHAQLLGIPPRTINANVQFLNNLGIEYNNGLLLGTKSQTKRQKMAWMLRELFDYRTISQEERKETINGLYDFLREQPQVLVQSISSMEKNKDKLREKVAQYKI